ncbi:MAG: hypothetical protein ACYDCL_00825 [Myxococcales bacterium]
MAIWLAAGILGCAHPLSAAPRAPAGGPGGGVLPVADESMGRTEVREGEEVRIEGRRYVDPRLDFEISRPAGDWLFTPGQPLTEGIAVPVIVAHPQSGAQVVVQIAPAVATPGELALRLESGLRARPGFSPGSPAPLEGTDDGVGFPFTMGDAVTGRVAILSGSGRVFVLLATWPTASPATIVTGIDHIVHSLKTTLTKG